MATQGYYEHKSDVIARLKKAEGQVRGLQRMVERDEYCIDILTQIAAVNIRHCIVESHAGESTDMIAEATAAIERLVKS
jgi:DNA-binding FrmR family transcriptional regulator